MNRQELFSLLYNGYPFIYKTESIGIKYIGLPVFRDCVPEEIKLYEQYISEFENVSALSYTPNQNDVGKLIEIFEEILTKGDVEYSSEAARKSACDLRDMIANLSDFEIDELYDQYRNKNIVFDYCDGAFYRHAKN